MELTDKSTAFIPKTVAWEKEGVHLFLDPEAPHWIATDHRAAQLIRWIEEGFSFGPMIRRYAERYGVEPAKAWLHVHDFVHSLLRSGFAQAQPVEHPPYLGRAAYARGGGSGAASSTLLSRDVPRSGASDSRSHAKPRGLKELWFHTNNICNLSCGHCLVSSAPWVQDWGIPTGEFLRLVDEAVELGVGRFYFTGGEPFMRRDLFQLIRYVTETKDCELIVLTNATLLQADRVQQLTTLNRDKVRFQVSLDGAKASTNDPIRGKGSFESAVGGLRRLNALGFQMSITTAVVRSNLEELTAITGLAHRLGVKTQHLMWLHRRGRLVGEEVSTNGAGVSSRHPLSKGKGNGGEGTDLTIPDPQRLIDAVRAVQAEARRLGVAVDNVESIKRRVNARPGVKYDLGNACWDSLCIYSDASVYPSAAMANVKMLRLGSVKERPLREIWETSALAEAFRQASVARKVHLAEDPLRYLTGGGDLEHSFWFNLDGESATQQIAPERLLKILSGPDPYYPVYQAMIEDALWETALEKASLVNRKSGYDAPRIFHAMGDGAIHCATDDLAVAGEVDVRTLHSNCVLAFDVEKPRKLVREFYSKAAETPQAELCCPTKFDPESIGHIPKEVIDRFYGCGSPVTLAQLQAAETMLDLGSGAGIDCFIASKIVGQTGRVIGIDMTDEMLRVANENRPFVARNLGFDNVEFRKGFLESVPVEDQSVDLVTSNCVINLSPDKPKVFAEIWRILKDHGRTVIADIVSDRPVPAHLKVNPQLWGECIVGALTQDQFLAQLQEAGFYGLTIMKKVYWKMVEGFDFYSVTVRGYKFEKKTGCRFIGQKAVYLGPMKSVMDEEGHLFPRDVEVEVCTDTAAKLSRPPYAGSFIVLEPSSEGHPRPRSGPRAGSSGDQTLASPPQSVADPPPAGAGMTEPAKNECGPGCC